MPGTKKDLRIRIAGETERLSRDLFAVSQGVLRAAPREELSRKVAADSEAIAGQEEEQND